MLLADLLNQSIQYIDNACSRVQIRIGERRGGLITLFVHNLFLDAAEIELNLAYPQQCLTVSDLERCLKYFQAAGYRFVSPQEIIEGLDPNGRHALLTFDDGYFNNTRALPLMESHGVPALFFVSAGMIQEGKAYWWDQLYQIRRSEGRSQAEAFAEIARQTGRRTDEIEAQFSKELNVRAFRAASDVDRLFTPQELRDFASHPLVSIGNHGCFHEFLPAYPVSEAGQAILRAQQILQEITGKPPLAIAYPYGAYSPEVCRLARQAGLHLGFGTEPRKQYVSSMYDENQRMRWGRQTLMGSKSIEAQCHLMRSDLTLHSRYRSLVENLKRRIRQV